jgi:hypothetical protein
LDHIRLADAVIDSVVVVGDAAWPAIIDRATNHRLSGAWMTRVAVARTLAGRVHPLVGLVYCASCGGRMMTAIAPRRGRGYDCRKDSESAAMNALVEDGVIQLCEEDQLARSFRSTFGLSESAARIAAPWSRWLGAFAFGATEPARPPG